MELDELAVPGAEDAERKADGLPPPEPIVPDPMVGPPAPNPTLDNLMAGMPSPAAPAPAAPDLPVPDVPPIGANPDAVDQALAEAAPPGGPGTDRTVPGVAPVVPGAPVPPDGPTTKSALPVAEDVIQRQGALNEQIAQDKADGAKREAEEAKLNAADTQDAIDHGNARLSERKKHYDDALDRYSGMKSYDYFDPENPQKHSKLMAGLSIAFGGLGASMTGAGGGSTENHALSQLKNNIDTNWKHQNDNIERARDSVVMARTGIEDAKDAKKALIEDNNAKRVAVLDSMQAEARAQLAERGVPQSKIDTDQRILDLQAARTKAAQQADEQRRKDALTDAQTKLLEAKAAREARRGKVANAGGVGKEQALVAALQKTGGEITPEVAAVADKLGVKPADLRGMSANFKQERRTDMGDRKITNAEASKFATENQLPEITKRFQSLNKINGLLSGDVDPETQIQALQEYEKASKGGTATAASMQSSLSHLAGGTDKIDQFFEKVRSGGLSSEQLGNLRTSVQRALSATKDEGDTVHEAWNQTFRNPDSYPDQDAINRLSDSYFAGLGYKRPAAKPAAGGGAKGAPVATSPVTAQLAGAQAWLADPKNATSPLRGAIQAKVDALQGTP